MILKAFEPREPGKRSRATRGTLLRVRLHADGHGVRLRLHADGLLAVLRGELLHELLEHVLLDLLLHRTAAPRGLLHLLKHLMLHALRGLLPGHGGFERGFELRLLENA